MTTNQSSWPDSGQILCHQYGISVAESQTFLLAKRLWRRRARRNGCIRRLFTCYLNCKYHPWELMIWKWVYIIGNTGTHCPMASLCPTEGDWRPPHPPSPVSKSGSRLPIHVFNSVCLGLVPGQIDSPCLIIMSWITIPRDENHLVTSSDAVPLSYRRLVGAKGNIFLTYSPGLKFTITFLSYFYHWGLYLWKFF